MSPERQPCSQQEKLNDVSESMLQELISGEWQDSEDSEQA